MLFDTLALISLIIIILLLNRMVNVFPSLMACAIRWKENVNLAMSVKLSRDRDMIAAAMIIPFCLLIYRFRLYFPEFMKKFDENIGIGVIIGIFAAYFLLRYLLIFIVSPKKLNPAGYRIAAASSRTFFIILTLFLLAAGGIMTFADTDFETIRTAMIWISAVIYSIFIFRKIQIFASSYNFFIVFLYLCALEILPTGIIIVSALIF